MKTCVLLVVLAVVFTSGCGAKTEPVPTKVVAPIKEPPPIPPAVD